MIKKTALMLLTWLFLNVRAVNAQELVETSGKIDFKLWNGISYLISEAVNRGVPENTVALLLLLPLVATLVSVIHYVIGFSGYGIFIPTMMAVALLATGVGSGLILFAVILAITLLSNVLVKKLKLHFWPARSITLLFVSMGTFGAMVLASYIKMVDVSKISIFPILFMILLTEEFARTQLVKSKKEAVKLTMGTLVLAVVGAMMMGVRGVEGMVLKRAEIVILIVVIINVLVGRYGGIRLTEIKRFKGAIRRKEKSLKTKA